MPAATVAQGSKLLVRPRGGTLYPQREGAPANGHRPTEETCCPNGTFIAQAVNAVSEAAGANVHPVDDCYGRHGNPGARPSTWSHFSRLCSCAADPRRQSCGRWKSIGMSGRHSGVCFGALRLWPPSTPIVLFTLLTVLAIVFLAPVDRFSADDAEEAGQVVSRGEEFWQAVHFESVPQEAWDALRMSPDTIETADPRLVNLLKLARYYFGSWMPIPNIKQGFGSRGTWKLQAVRGAATQPRFMECCVHIRIVDGRVYFRYGGFTGNAHQLARANGMVVALQGMVDKFGMQDLRVELLFNTCDFPMSSDSSLTINYAGFLIFSTFTTTVNLDVPLPDPLHLGRSGEARDAPDVPWEEKESRAVFRGPSAVYHWRTGSLEATPQWRLHRLSDFHPALMDARVDSWNHVQDKHRTELEDQGIRLGAKLNATDKLKYKYELLLDGGFNSSSLFCDAIVSKRVLIQQETPYYSFYSPLRRPMKHFVETSHYFTDLVERVRYMKQHDKDMKAMGQRAFEDLRWMCTSEGHLLSLAVLMSTYESIMENPKLISVPKQVCDKPPLLEPAKLTDTRQRCKTKYANVSAIDTSSLPACTLFCSDAEMPEDTWWWLPAESLQDWKLRPEARTYSY